MSSRRMMLKSMPTDPELERLFKEAANHKMTKAEVAAQRKSWVIGEMMLEHPDMTRERAEAIYREIT